MTIPPDRNIWVIRGGSAGEAGPHFLETGVVAIGWDRLGDLRTLAPDREAFKRALTAAYPESKPGAIPVNAGQLFRFVHELAVGDVVLYPSRADRMIHIGTVEGVYAYAPSGLAEFPHTRPVRWRTKISRTAFTQGALYEIGSVLTVFMVKNYADEFLAALDEKYPLEPVAADPTIEVVTQDIADTTRDFVLKALARELKGHPLSGLVANLLNAMGYRTRISPPGPDGGVDIIAHRDELGFEPPFIKVQVKSSEGSVGDPIVSALYGKVAPGEFGLFVTLGVFTAPARAFAAMKTNLRLVDGEDLVNLILEHYDRLDPRYKGVIPLQQVYVPQSLG